MPSVSKYEGQVRQAQGEALMLSLSKYESRVLGGSLSHENGHGR